MAIMAILLKMAIMAWHNMAINMDIMSVSAKSWQNVDSLWKQIGQKMQSEGKKKIVKKCQKWPVYFVFLSET